MVNSKSHILITGGAGFIGTNLAVGYLSDGHPVTILDNFSRPGVEGNARWLRNRFPNTLRVIEGDVRDAQLVNAAVRDCDAVFHFAAQVAVTTSLTDPLLDHSINALGTLHVLEAVRKSRTKPSLVFTSTNKVYGSLDNVPLVRNGSRYEPQDSVLAATGVGEQQPLDFHSPYGCSKGSADQYVRDYARCFGLKAIVFRMSCICGPHQQGTEDQGWVAHFVRSALAHEPIVIYGDGYQVRDVLFVEDLVHAFRRAVEDSGRLQGRVFNMGGGPKRTTSILEVIDIIRRVTGIDPQLGFGEARVGDQKWYVSDCSEFTRASGWEPRATVEESVKRIATWLRSEAHYEPNREGVGECVLR